MFRFRRLRESDLEMVLRWRTRPDVTRYMNTDVAFDMARQKAWFRDVVQKNPAAGYWIIEYASRPIGVINLAGLDLANKRSSYGFYIGESDARQVGALVPPYFYNYVFSDAALGLHKITGEVMAENESVRRMHRFHGHCEVGICEDHVLKNGRWHNVVLFELLKSSWGKQSKKFSHYAAEFE